MPDTSSDSPSQETPLHPAMEVLIEDLHCLDDWDDRYRYLIDLGKSLPPLPPEAYNEANKVQGCASQVWLLMRVTAEGRLNLQGDSDALIVKGLVALVLTLFNGLELKHALQLDEKAFFAQIGLESHLTMQRANGLAAMVARIKAEALRQVS